jgi:transcriptional regulator with XRE-family HTH domain
MTSYLEVTAGQLRAARGLLGWSQSDLARAAGVGRQTVAKLELGEQTPLVSTLNRLVAAFMFAGIRFVNDEERGLDGEREGRGVRWHRPGPEGPNLEALKMFKLFKEGLKDGDQK